MGKKSKIEWTDSTWNPVTGCTKVSSGCKHCYAETFAERWRGIPGHPYEQGFDLKLWPDRLEIPLRWTKPRNIFINSMSDLFHEDVPEKFIQAVFTTMASARQHRFQILTKRPERMNKLLWKWKVRGLTLRSGFGSTLPNVWLGVSVEDQKSADERISILLDIPAEVRWISAEPLLTPLNLTRFLYTRGEMGGNRDLYNKLDWVVVGGESGPHCRPMDATWAMDIRDQCISADIPFFFKQKGGAKKKYSGRILAGRTWDQMPGNLSPETGQRLKVTIEDRIQAFCQNCDQVTKQLGVEDKKTLYYTVCTICNSVK